MLAKIEMRGFQRAKAGKAGLKKNREEVDGQAKQNNVPVQVSAAGHARTLFFLDIR